MTETNAQPAVDPQDAVVLVVEDNASNFVLIARLLAYMGVKKCEWKTTGWGLVDFASTLPHVDLILMDLRLPYEDGYEALAHIRQDPRFATTRVVVITAQATTAELERARTAGFDGFIAKPLDVARFPDQIRAILQGQSVWDLGS